MQSPDDVRRLPFLEKTTRRDAYPDGLRLCGLDNIIECTAPQAPPANPRPSGSRAATWTRGRCATHARCGWWACVPATSCRTASPTLPTSIGLQYGAQRAGIGVVPAHIGRQERLIDLLMDLGVTSLCTTPSCGLYLADKAKERGIDLAVHTIGTKVWYTELAAGHTGFSYVAFTLWWVALSYLAFPRILFAWGMDRMGPKWFTDINPRSASPVKNYLVCFVFGEALLVLYYTLLTDQMQNIIVTGFQVTSVFIATAIAPLLFPFVKRARGVWDSSPYKTWTLLGVPVVVWGAIIDFICLGILLYYFAFNDAAKQFTAAGNIILVTAWVLGILWYFFWKQRSKRVGVDVSMTYGELPPE